MSRFVGIKTFYKVCSTEAHKRQLDVVLSSMETENSKRKFSEIMHLEEVNRKRQRIEETERSIVTNLQKEVEEITKDIDVLFDPETETSWFKNYLTERKPQTRRPEDWRTIAEAYLNGAGVSRLLKDYESLSTTAHGGKASDDAIRSRVRRWAPIYTILTKKLHH